MLSKTIAQVKAKIVARAECERVRKFPRPVSCARGFSIVPATVSHFEQLARHNFQFTEMLDTVDNRARTFDNLLAPKFPWPVRLWASGFRIRRGQLRN